MSLDGHAFARYLGSLDRRSVIRCSCLAAQVSETLCPRHVTVALSGTKHPPVMHVAKRLGMPFAPAGRNAAAGYEFAHSLAVAFELVAKAECLFVVPFDAPPPAANLGHKSAHVQGACGLFAGLYRRGWLRRLRGPASQQQERQRSQSHLLNRIAFSPLRVDGMRGQNCGARAMASQQKLVRA